MSDAHNDDEIGPVVGCSFVGCTFASTDIAPDKPVIIGDPARGNVAFPASMSEHQRREWRILMDMPGAEWPPGD